MKERTKYAWVFVFCFAYSFGHAQLNFVFDDAARPDSFSVPFHIQGSLIQVDVLINGQPEKFVLDNGAPYLVMNTRRWGRAVQADTAIKAKGIGGKVDAGAIPIDVFDWQGVRKQNFKAISADLPLLGDSIGGLLGVDVYKGYSILFDYENRRISFARPGFLPADTLAQSVQQPLQWALHMPVVAMQIGKDTLQMGLDCGASTCLLPATALSVVGELQNVRNTILTGAGTPIAVLEGEVKEAGLQGLLYKNMKFTFDDNSLQQINQVSPLKIDGLLGLPFLMRYKTVLDFSKKLITVYTKQQP